jgi:exodeoxyribonuclease VII small subunit
MLTMHTKRKSMAKPNFEDAMKRLEEIVRKLEGGELALDASLEAFEEGMKLVGFCSQKLEEAEQKVNILIKESGGYTLKPFVKDENTR